MTKVFYEIIVGVIVICFCGVVPSDATHITKMVQNDGNSEMAVSALGTISNANYVDEVYTTSKDSSESAVRVFSAGDDVYLVTRFYMAFTGEIAYYRFLSNAAGSISHQLIDSFNITSTGSWTDSKKVSGLTAGVYYYTTVILAPGNNMIPPSGFMFIVE
jgi:hypothetical protein